MPRIYPRVVVRRNVRNQSSRNGGRPDLIVLHTTESHNRPGTSDLTSIAAWFDNPAAQASSHVVVDADGTSARLVSDGMKAWTQAAYNPRALSVEQIGHASTSRSVWKRSYRLELDETARWIAYWSRKHDIPIRRVRPHQSGVIGHQGLGIAGGGHHDPGEHYPWRYVLGRARVYRVLQNKKD